MRGGRAGRIPDLGQPGRGGVKSLVQHDETLSRFLARIPVDVADSFNEAQLLAVKRAFAEHFSRQHPVDIRLTLLRRYYLVVLAGRERRDGARRRRDRHRRPLLRLANVMFVNGVVVLLLLAVVTALYLLTAAIDGGTAEPGGGTWDTLLQQFRLMWRS